MIGCRYWCFWSGKPGKDGKCPNCGGLPPKKRKGVSQ